MESNYIDFYFTVDDFLIVFAVFALLIAVIFTLLLVNLGKTRKIRKKYESFMQGKMQNH